MFMQSTWVRENPGVVAKIWQVGIIQDWTMRYRGHNPRHGIERCCQLHYTCKYHGNTDPNTGLPDGLGRWLDDAREGETLTGYCKFQTREFVLIIRSYVQTHKHSQGIKAFLWLPFHLGMLVRMMPFQPYVLHILKQPMIRTIGTIFFPATSVLPQLA